MLKRKYCLAIRVKLKIKVGVENYAVLVRVFSAI
jgi:hypothetical protein